MDLKIDKFVTALVLGVLLLGFGLPAEAKSPPGWGWATQKAKRAALSNPQTSKAMRGWFKQQVKQHQRKGKTGFPYLKSPPGMDVGHNPMKRGSIKLKDLRWEYANDNRSRPGRARGRATRKGLPAPKYF